MSDRVRVSPVALRIALVVAAAGALGPTCTKGNPSSPSKTSNGDGPRVEHAMPSVEADRPGEVTPAPAHMQEQAVGTASIPPGPPGPPPPPGARPAQDVSRYRDYLTKAGKPTDDLVEAEHLRIGDWRFYYRSPAPGVQQDLAALDGAGHVVGDAGADWRELLSTAGLDASGAHQRVAWLLQAAPIQAGFPVEDSAKKKIVAPSLSTSSDGTVSYVGWVVYPPAMKSPSRVTITAPRKGPATVNTTPARDVP